MRIFIPGLGTHLRLTRDWSFVLHNERRNTTLREVYGLETRYVYHWKPETMMNAPAEPRVVLPAGTEMVIDRIYIRNGQKEFDSVTFRIPKQRIPAKEVMRSAREVRGPNDYHDFQYPYKIPSKQVRFWAKLEDVNTMEAEILNMKED